MKNKKLIIIVLIVLVIVSLGLVFIRKNLSGPSTKDIIEMLDNKETFNLFVSFDEVSRNTKTFEFYKDNYSLDYKSVFINEYDETYKKLIKKLGLEISKDDREFFTIIKDGNPQYSLIGVFSENHIRNLLITSKLIDEKYNEIDYLFNDDEFNKYFKKDKLYNVLFIDSGDENLYKYRSMLVQNNVPSLILYDGNLDSAKTGAMFRKELNLEIDVSDKLPILIKIKNGKILSSKNNINIDDFKKSISQ